MVFNALDLAKCSPSDPKELLEMFREMGPLRAASFGGLENDLESPAFECSPALEKLKVAIGNTIMRPILCADDEECGIGEPIMMSGSGTSIYCLTDDTPGKETEKKAIAKLLADNPGLQYFECSFLNKANIVDAWYE